MILLLILIGITVGACAAVAVLVAGAGLATAILSYTLFAIGAVVATALLVSLVSVWRARPVPAPMFGRR
jgi:hypothetical protein